MNKNFKQFLLAIIGLFVILPAFANTTVDLKNASSITLTSLETLNFGTVNAFGLNAGNPISSSSGLVSGNIKMLFLDKNKHTHQTEPTDIETCNGVIYYLEDALLLKVSSSLNLNMSLNVENTAGSLIVLISEDASYWPTSGTDISSFMIQALGNKTLETSLVSGATIPLDVGIYIPFSQEGGSKTSTVTFTAIEV